MQNKALVVKPVMEIEKDHDSSRLIEDLSDIQVPTKLVGRAMVILHRVLFHLGQC